MSSHLRDLLVRLENDLDLARARHRSVVDRIVAMERDLDLKGTERAVTQLEMQTLELREAIETMESAGRGGSVEGAKAQALPFPARSSSSHTPRGERTSKVLAAVEYINKLGRGATASDVVDRTLYSEANVRKCLTAEVDRGTLIKRAQLQRTGPYRRGVEYFISAAVVVDIKDARDSKEQYATHAHTIQDIPLASGSDPFFLTLALSQEGKA